MSDESESRAEAKFRPRTFGEQFFLEEASLFERLGRDLRLLRFFVMTFVMWWKARKIRAEFRRCRATGEPFYVDRLAPPGSK